ncbi:hypothetical protein [Prosthecobacter vanneervenii]|uniref:Uncharacterized protein n=1 Tax=Prosthecobacter vanneervenii TaxID=48466 RepID=A0A7W7Y6Q1_9BACT|nr:hypothetical protein [Prosthecobacter vanneervenii]MBB5030616.1 hypothetical protein [Prosthecobacter vanneervenii]
MLPSDTLEAATIGAWVEDTLLVDYDFHPEIIGDSSLIYKQSKAGSFLTALLDGIPSQRPEWAGVTQKVSDVFFRGLSTYLAETSSHLVQVFCHDGACWVIGRIQKLNSEPLYLPWILGLLHSEPADQGGATYLMLLADDRKSALVLADIPYEQNTQPYVEGFCIVFHGDDERTLRFMRHLENATSPNTEAILL